MIPLIPEAKYTVFACILLACSSATFANVQNDELTTSQGCTSSEESTNMCIHYTRGYLNALQRMNNMELNSNFAAFEERAFKTRVGNNSSTAVFQNKLNLCLPKEVSAREILV